MDGTASNRPNISRHVKNFEMRPRTGKRDVWWVPSPKNCAATEFRPNRDYGSPAAHRPASRVQFCAVSDTFSPEGVLPPEVDAFPSRGSRLPVQWNYVLLSTVRSLCGEARSSCAPELLAHHALFTVKTREASSRAMMLQLVQRLQRYCTAPWTRPRRPSLLWSSSASTFLAVCMQ